VKKRYLLLLIPILIAVLDFCPRWFLPASTRTSAYFAICRAWYRAWPMETGNALPTVLESAAKPMVPVWADLEPGIRMWLDPADMVSYRMLGMGRWEVVSNRIIAEHLPPGGTFIDVGAHIGYYSLKAAQRAGKGGHVLAVEPNPKTLEVLRRNIAASGAATVTVVPVACSDTETVLDFYEAAEANTGESSLSKQVASQSGGAVAIKVQARPLDAIVRDNGLTRVDAIKVDVEGAEYMVLKGGGQTLDRFHPMILVEVIESQLVAMGASRVKLVELLAAHGYREGRHDLDNIEFIAAR
jgi:FkbM family methyltransferase